MPKKPSCERSQIEIDGIAIPVKIYRESRPGIRASIGKRAAILRLPLRMSKQVETERLRWFSTWVKKQFRRNRGLLEQFRKRSYRSGDHIRVGKKSYRLDVTEESRKTHSARLQGDIIALRLSREDKGASREKNIQHLLSRVVAQDFLPEITKRVHELNTQHFGKAIKKVHLKYNQSNWGSCSVNGNINLSTRLLFAPDEVVDYVIIHELTHLVEFNHSPRFWKIIKQIIPDYQQKELWLKENGGRCRF